MQLRTAPRNMRQLSALLVREVRPGTVCSLPLVPRSRVFIETAAASAETNMAGGLRGMRIHITNTSTGQVTEIDERQLRDIKTDLRRSKRLNIRGESTLYIWHGPEASAPVLEYRDMHGKKARRII